MGHPAGAPSGGSLATLGAGGAEIGKRFLGGALCGVATGFFFSGGSQALSGWTATPAEALVATIWVVFILTVLSTIGAILTELFLPEPRKTGSLRPRTPAARRSPPGCNLLLRNLVYIPRTSRESVPPGAPAERIPPVHGGACPNQERSC